MLTRACERSVIGAETERSGSKIAGAGTERALKKSWSVERHELPAQIPLQPP